MAVGDAIGRLFFHFCEDVANDFRGVDVDRNKRELRPGKGMVEVVFEEVVFREVGDISFLDRREVVTGECADIHGRKEVGGCRRSVKCWKMWLGEEGGSRADGEVSEVVIAGTKLVGSTTDSSIPRDTDGYLELNFSSTINFFNLLYNNSQNGFCICSSITDLPNIFDSLKNTKLSSPSSHNLLHKLTRTLSPLSHFLHSSRALIECNWRLWSSY